MVSFLQQSQNPDRFPRRDWILSVLCYHAIPGPDKKNLEYLSNRGKRIQRMFEYDIKGSRKIFGIDNAKKTPDNN